MSERSMTGAHTNTYTHTQHTHTHAQKKNLSNLSSFDSVGHVQLVLVGVQPHTVGAVVTEQLWFGIGTCTSSNHVERYENNEFYEGLSPENLCSLRSLHSTLLPTHENHIFKLRVIIKKYAECKNTSLFLLLHLSTKALSVSPWLCDEIFNPFDFCLSCPQVSSNLSSQIKMPYHNHKHTHTHWCTHMFRYTHAGTHAHTHHSVSHTC